MLKKLILITATITIGLAAFNVTIAGEPSLKDQIVAVDKELFEMRKTTVSDPQVKAAQAKLQVALANLKAAEDEVLVRTNPKGKELVEKLRKLLAQYQAEQKAEKAQKNPKP